MKQTLFPCTIFKKTVTGDEKWIIYSNMKKNIYICTLYEEGTVNS